MKVLIIAKCHHRHLNGILIFHEALRQNKDVDLVCYDDGFSNVINQIKEYEPDWVFQTGYGVFSRKQEEEIKKYAKLLIWNPDSIDEDRKKIWLGLKGVPDIILSSHLCVAQFLNQNRVGKYNFFVPQYYDDEYYKFTQDRLDPKQQIYDVCFIGAGDRRRIRWCQEISRLFKTAICGIIGGRRKNNVYGSEMANTYRQSKIVIDMPWVKFPCTDDYDTSDRIYKAMGCGAFYLTYPIKKLDLFFRTGYHLDTYSPVELKPLIEKIRYYLARNKEREMIALQGQKEVLLKHTLRTRLQEMWDKMEGLEEC